MAKKKGTTSAIVDLEHYKVERNGLTQEIVKHITDGMWGGATLILPNPDKLLRSLNGQAVTGYTYKADEAYRDVLIDGRVYGLYQRRKSGIPNRWDLVAGKGTSAKALEVISDILSDIEAQKTLLETMAGETVAFGYQPFELIWQSVGKYLSVGMIKDVPRWGFQFSTRGNLIYNDYTKGEPQLVRRFDGTAEEPGEIARKFLCPRQEPTFENPYGIALLSKCYWNTYFKRNGKKDWALYLERFGMPWPVGQYPDGTEIEKVIEYAHQLSNQVRDGVIMTPDTVNIDMLNGSSGSTDSFERFIADANTENSIVWLGHEGNVQATPGKLGSEDAALTAASWLVEADTYMVENTMRDVVRWLEQVNFGTDTRIEFKLVERDEEGFKKIGRDTQLFAIGVQFEPEYITETYGIEDGFFTMATAIPTLPAGHTEKQTVSETDPAPINEEPPQFSAEDAQAAVDALVGKQIASGTIAVAMDKIVGVIEEFTSSEESFVGAQKKLAALFPKLTLDKIQQMIYRSVGAAELEGRHAEQQQD